MSGAEPADRLVERRRLLVADDRPHRRAGRVGVLRPCDLIPAAPGALRDHRVRVELELEERLAEQALRIGGLLARSLPDPVVCVPSEQQKPRTARLAILGRGLGREQAEDLRVVGAFETAPGSSGEVDEVGDPIAVDREQRWT